MAEPSQLRSAVHLWSASLSRVEAASASVLDEHERQTAARFRFAAKRRDCVKSRWLLRHILSRYVGERPGAIRIAYGDKGKPYLPDHAVSCSVSHSHDRWIAALAGGREIGADIERVAPLDGMDAIIRTYFHPQEQERLSALAPERKIFAFYRHWTQMEAFVKLHGIGLYARMNTIRGSGRGLLFEGAPGSLAACESYVVHPGYIISIAMKGDVPPVVPIAWHSDEEQTQGGVKDACIPATRSFP